MCFLGQLVQGDKQKGMQLLKGIFNERGYTACVDFPSSLYYAELFKMNPEAKVGRSAQ